MSEFPSYREAAEHFKATNPDGWYDDPESTLALSESMWEAGQRGEDPLEVARREWKHAQAKFLATGQDGYAGMMVAIEQEVESWKGKVA